MTTIRLEYQSPEQQLLDLIVGWKPLSGFGEVTIRLEYQDDRIVRVVRLNSEESVKF